MGEGEKKARLVYTSGVSAFTGEPFVQMELHRGDGAIEAVCQMTPDEARKHGTYAITVATAAEHDAMLVAVMREDIEAPVEYAGMLLQMMRDRHGRASGETAR